MLDERLSTQQVKVGAAACWNTPPPWPPEVSAPMTKKTISTLSPYRQLLREHNARPEMMATDLAVERAPEVVRLRRHVLKLADQVQDVQARPRDRRAFMRYS